MTDDPKMAAVLANKRERRRKGWKSSADHPTERNMAKARAAVDEFVAWMKARTEAV